MKTQEEIEQLSKIIVPTPMEGTSYVDVRYGFIQGYTQCQEDMADKKYTEEDLMSAFSAGIDNNHGIGLSFDQWLNSLNKQEDE